MKKTKRKSTLISAMIALQVLFGCSNNHQKDTEQQSELKEKVHQIMKRAAPTVEAIADSTDSLDFVE